MSVQKEPGKTRPTPVHRTTPSVTDTQPMRAARSPERRKPTWLWLVVIPILVFVVWGLAAIMGYVAGQDLRQANQIQSIAQISKEQFDLGIEDLLAGNYEFAKQRFEYVLSLDPQYPGAAELLGQALESLQQPTPTPSPIVSPTPSATPDLTSYDGVFQSSQAAFNGGDWSAALDLLLLLRGKAPDFKLLEVNQLMQTALRNRGMDKLFQGQLEEGIYDLYLAERFGPLDTQASNWRRSAEFYMFANSYFGLDWPLATEYFGQICVANIWAACTKYAQSAREYGHLLVAEEDYCQAVLQYEQFFQHLDDQAFAPTATKVAEACLTATAPTPTPTATMTPGTETPEGTFTNTPTPSSTGTLTPSPSISATPSSTILGPTYTPTSTATPTPSASPTPSPTSTPTPSPTATPS
jgi:tetratricopeptide (TPR) repeat protein